MPDRDTWEKSDSPELARLQKKNGRIQFLVGGLLILGAVFYLVVNSTSANAQPYRTVEEVANNPDYVGQQITVTGAVIGSSIDYDSENLEIAFTIAQLPGEYDNLAEALNVAANDPTRTQLAVFVENQPKPDLLRHEAQAILKGYIRDDGVFYASELLLKCPSRLEDGGSRDNLEEHPGMQFIENDAS
jgi:cytochrome c-type biogenesis protein CcmE